MSLFLKIVEFNSFYILEAIELLRLIFFIYVSHLLPLPYDPYCIFTYTSINRRLIITTYSHAPSFPLTVYAELRYIFTIFIAYMIIILTFHANFILRDCIVKIARNNVLINDSWH